MKLLITGAAGQVGRELMDAAPAYDCEAIGFDSRQLDITDAAAVAAVLAQCRPACVINAAAYTAVDRAESEAARAYAVNRDGVEYLARACRDLDIPLLHLSTDYVFDGAQPEPYTEAHNPNPGSVYGASKLAGEQVLAATWHKHAIVRVSWVFGQYGNNFVKTMLRLGRERSELNVVADQFGAPTAARAIAAVLLALATHPALGSDELPWGVRHLASAPGVTWYDFARSIFERAAALGLLERTPVVHPISSDAYPTPVKRPANSRLTSVVGWADLAACCDWKADLDAVLAALR